MAEERTAGTACRDCLSCKCGEERHDVQFGQTRLALTFISLNLVAASLGLNNIATSSASRSGLDVDTSLGRGSFTSVTTADLDIIACLSESLGIGDVTDTADSLLIDGTVSNAQIKVEYDFVDKDTCESVEFTVGITKSECEDIIEATNIWVIMGVLSTATFAILFAMLLRVECRQLCSRPMRQVMMGILFLGFIFTMVSWIVIVASPIPDKFDDLQSSVWIMVIATGTSMLCIFVSVLDYRGAGGGPAPAAKYS